MIVQFRKFNRFLTTRHEGRAAYDAVMAVTDSLAGHTIFDFSGVECVTNSFADEVFGRMARDLGIDTLKTRTTFKAVPAHIAKVIRAAIDRRDSERTPADLAPGTLVRVSCDGHEDPEGTSRMVLGTETIDGRILVHLTEATGRPEGEAVAFPEDLVVVRG